MPLKTEEGQVVIGRVESEYEFMKENNPGFQHTRKVAWDPGRVSRATLGADIRATLGSLLTVCEIEKHNAAERLQTIMEEGGDPGLGDPQGQITSFSDLKEKAPVNVSIRKLLELIDAYRRTAGTVATLTEKLEEHGLEISRPIDSGLIDDEVEVRTASSDDPSGEEPLIDDPQEESEEYSLRVDYKVSAIQSASLVPASVAPDDTILKAQTMMLENNYSQLAVIEEQGGLYGAITWESISIASFYQTPSLVREALAAAPITVEPRHNVLDVFHMVLQNGFVFVASTEEAVGGIITIEDIAQEFGKDRVPLQLVEEIELRIRRAVRKNFSEQDLKDANINPPQFDRLTLGKYPYLLQHNSNWNKLQWPGVDEERVITLIKKAAKIRNSLMHFSQDPILNQEMRDLEGLVRILRAVDKTTRERHI